jgi:hypothetical protein
MVGRDIQYEVFDCDRIGSVVMISRETLVLHSSTTDEIDRSAITGIDCDHKYECGVCKASESSISTDWGKCVHPDLRE